MIVRRPTCNTQPIKKGNSSLALYIRAYINIPTRIRRSISFPRLPWPCRHGRLPSTLHTDHNRVPREEKSVGDRVRLLTSDCLEIATGRGGSWRYHRGRLRVRGLGSACYLYTWNCLVVLTSRDVCWAAAFMKKTLSEGSWCQRRLATYCGEVIASQAQFGEINYNPVVRLGAVCLIRQCLFSNVP